MQPRFRIVLVSPMYAGNVGAVARIALNFDLRELLIVAPLCYYKRREAEPMAPLSEDPAALDEIEELFTHWRQTMVDAGLTTGGNPERLLAPLKRVVLRAHPQKKEVAALRAYLGKMQAALGTKKRGGR